jgi:hypothetical protein
MMKRLLVVVLLMLPVAAFAGYWQVFLIEQDLPLSQVEKMCNKVSEVVGDYAVVNGVTNFPACSTNSMPVYREKADTNTLYWSACISTSRMSVTTGNMTSWIAANVAPPAKVKHFESSCPSVVIDNAGYEPVDK